MFSTEKFCNYDSDTMASTLRWLVLTLAHFPDIQSKCLEEILGFDQKTCAAGKISFLESEKYDQLDKSKCPYFSSVLLENMRWHPVAESFSHQATENLTIGGYEIKKGTTVVGSK